MIGDRESPDEPEAEDWGPLLHMTRLNPPPERPGQITKNPPAWVEHYDRMVVVRHYFPGARHGSFSECRYPSDGRAVRAMASQIAFLLGRGYTLVDENRTASRGAR